MSDGYITEPESTVGEIEPGAIETIPVHIASYGARPSREAAPEYASVNTWAINTLAVMGAPVQILPRKYRRHKARIYIPSLGTITGTPPTAEGSVTSPGTSATIASITAPNVPLGDLLIKWNVSLGGTVGTVDANNFKIQGGGISTALTSDNPGAVGGPWEQEAVQQLVTAQPGSPLTVKSIAAGTVASVYTAQIAIQTLSAITGTMWFASIIDRLTLAVPQGLQVTTAPFFFEWESQRPLYVILSAGSAGPLSVSVIDESYEET